MNTKTKVVLSFLLIFMVGFASGYLVKSTFSLKSHHSFQQERIGERGYQQSGEMSQAERMERGRNRLARRLNLTDEQRESFFPAMHEYYSEVRQTVRVNRESEHDYLLQRYSEFRDQISETLSSDQLQQMDGILHPDTVRANRPNYHRDRN